LDDERKITAKDVLILFRILAGLKVWSLATFFGGSLFVLYYFHIGYMPELDVKSLTAVLFAAAFSGMFVIFSFSIIFVLPSIVWRVWVDSTGQERYKRLNFSTGDEEDRKNLFFFFGGPFLFLLSAFIIYTYQHDMQNWHSWPRYSEIVLILISLCLLIYGARKNKLGFFNGLCYVAGWCITWSFFMLPLVVIISMIPNKLQEGVANLAIVGVIILSCVLVNMAAVKLSAEKTKNGSEIVRKSLGILALGGVVLLLLFTVSNSWSSIPLKVMRDYALGDMQNVAIVINDEGKKIIEQIGVDTKYSASLKGSRIVDLTLLSRLGQEYLFCKGQCQAPYQKDDLRFTLPKSTVMSITWNVRDKKETK
jgi:hypothetical protein